MKIFNINHDDLGVLVTIMKAYGSAFSPKECLKAKSVKVQELAVYNKIEIKNDRVLVS